MSKQGKKTVIKKDECPSCGEESYKGQLCSGCASEMARDREEREDVYEHMSPRDQEWNDRLDYANEVAKTDPERAAEIRHGA